MKKTDVLFLHPPTSLEDRYGVLSSGGSSLPPFGLAWLAAAAREAGFEAAILDAAAETLDLEGTLARIGAHRGAVLAMTATTLSLHRAEAVAAEARRRGLVSAVLLGGPHASAVPEATLAACPSVDLLVLGEGERTLVEILPEILDRGIAAARGAAGTFCRDADGGFVQGPPRPPIENLDELPLPAFDLLPDLTRHYQTSALRSRHFPGSSLVTSRGCFGRCTFCSRSVFGRKVRAFSADYVMAMIRSLVDGWGIREICIYDDNFVADPRRLKRFCELLRAAPFRLTWTCNARVDVVTEESLRRMRDAGCWQISFGVESGVQEILDRECKGITLEKVRATLAVCRRLGIRTKGFFMVGHPGETRETMEATRRFALELPLDDFQMSFLTPFPGTELHDEAGTWGRLDDDWPRMNMWTPVFVPEGLTADDLVAAQKRAIRSFYLRPRVILRYLLVALSSPRRFVAVLRGAWAFVKALFARR